MLNNIASLFNLSFFAYLITIENRLQNRKCSLKINDILGMIASICVTFGDNCANAVYYFYIFCGTSHIPVTLSSCWLSIVASSNFPFFSFP